MNLDLWIGLEAQARWRLEHADELPPRDSTRGMALLLRIWRYPRSGSHVSWSILLPVPDHRQRRSVVREVAWDRLADWKRQNSRLEALKRRSLLEPSVRTRDAELDWADLLPQLEVLSGLPAALPASRSPAVSKDDEFGLEGHRSLAHVRLRWSGKGPRGWAGPLSRVSKLRNLLMRTMDERDVERV
jgi:hypothetical protein